jgi:hypothetical protein
VGVLKRGRLGREEEGKTLKKGEGDAFSSG